jgi:hypothetical protein
LPLLNATSVIETFFSPYLIIGAEKTATIFASSFSCFIRSITEGSKDPCTPSALPPNFAITTAAKSDIGKVARLQIIYLLSLFDLN